VLGIFPSRPLRSPRSPRSVGPASRGHSEAQCYPGLIVRSLLLAALLAAVTGTLATALVTRDGVGAVEYLVGAVLLAVFLVALVRASRRAIRRA
jgi:hypothetical protein